ncbi:hypothetical protein KRX56_06280 [Dermabacteraceae bacterium TAE3-ERU27]|nr:hypothetical protein [Dermabacteraceae bacterium TAE3-ERU27]
MSRIECRLVGVYNANGGLAGELSYVIGKIRGTAHCGLCDISHGKRPMYRKEWKEMVQRLPLPLETVHLNEVDASTSRLLEKARSPFIALIDGENDRVLVSAEELDGCGGDSEALFALLSHRVAE